MDSVINSLCIVKNVDLGKQVRLSPFCNLYECEIGDFTFVGPFVEIQKQVKLGKNCKISSHTFVCSGVSIGDNCFVGHGVMFINDNYPQSVNRFGELESPEDWVGRFIETKIENDVSIGSNATILGGIKIGRAALVGAGSVVVNDVPAGIIVAGNPAREIGKRQL